MVMNRLEMLGAHQKRDGSVLRAAVCQNDARLVQAAHRVASIPNNERIRQASAWAASMLGWLVGVIMTV
jgi:hypothetical protein